MAPRPRLHLPSRRPPSLPSSCSRPSIPVAPLSLPAARQLSFSAPTLSSTSSSAPERIPPAPPKRWLSDLRARIGKCIIFGCDNLQVARAASVLRALAEEWRPLTAGSQGFLSGGRRGLDGHNVVWGEQDSFGHVNNVNYFRYAESARVNWITNFAVHADPVHRKQWSELMTPKSIGLIMGTLKSEFKLPVTYPDRISVYHKLRHDPSTSSSPPSAFALECIILSHNARRIAARLEEEIVIYDYRAGRKTAMPDYMIALFGETYRLQQHEMRRARARIWELISQVESLERETWDRDDAVEDTGSAGKSS